LSNTRDSRNTLSSVNSAYCIPLYTTVIGILCYNLLQFTSSVHLFVKTIVIILYCIGGARRAYKLQYNTGTYVLKREPVCIFFIFFLNTQAYSIRIHYSVASFLTSNISACSNAYYNTVVIMYHNVSDFLIITRVHAVGYQHNPTWSITRGIVPVA